MKLADIYYNKIGINANGRMSDMGLANCKECGKLYVQNPAGLCQDCYRIEEENEEN